MKNNFSFFTEAIPGDQCFLMDANGLWSEGYCKACNTSVESKDKLNIWYIGTFGPAEDLDEFYWMIIQKGCIANRDSFLEWQSRLIDLAKDSFKFKGDIDKMFGPISYSNWIPFYLDDIPPSNAYMIGMGLIENKHDN